MVPRHLGVARHRYTFCMQDNDVARTWYSSVATTMSISTLSTRFPRLDAVLSSKYACLMCPLHNILPFRSRVTRITALNAVTCRVYNGDIGRRFLSRKKRNAKVNKGRLYRHCEDIGTFARPIFPNVVKCKPCVFIPLHWNQRISQARNTKQYRCRKKRRRVSKNFRAESIALLGEWWKKHIWHVF